MGGWFEDASEGTASKAKSKARRRDIRKRGEFDRSRMIARLSKGAMNMFAQARH